MLVPRDQIIVGVVVTLLCLNGLWLEQRILDHTKYGQRFVRWFGERRAPWVLRGLLVAGALVGTLLAFGIVNPLKW